MQATVILIVHMFMEMKMKLEMEFQQKLTMELSNVKNCLLHQNFGMLSINQVLSKVLSKEV